MNNTTKKVALTGLFAALSYVIFTFLKIDFPVPGGGSVPFHLGNMVVVLGALIIGGPLGGLAGAIGLSIGDLFDARYVASAPKTFFLKLCIGLIVGLVAHYIFHITHEKNNKKVLLYTIISATAGLLFNCIFDPIVGYYYKILILGKPAAEVALKYDITATTVNAVASIIVATIAYMALRKPLKSAGLFFTIGKNKKNDLEK